MKICIPTFDDRGLESRIHDHFGSAPYFTFADTEADVIEVTPNAGHCHDHGTCDPVGHIDANRTDAVVCRGMGKRALASLERGGVAVLITSVDTVREVLAEARNGRLRSLTMDVACGGHGHGHRH